MMRCSGCDVPIPPLTKYLCIYETPIGFNLAVGCGHYTPPAGWNYVFGGSDCFDRWMENFKLSLRKCKHEGGQDEPIM